MNVLEHQLDYVFGATVPEPGSAHEVAPGIKWLRMPLPFALDHINLWLLRDTLDGRDGWTVIDCGIASDSLKAHWETIFATALDGLPVLRVVVTHFHPDHLGLADWICHGGDQRRWNVRVWMTLGEYLMGRVLTASGAEDSSAGGEAAARFFARHGLTTPEWIDGIAKRKGYYKRLVPSVPQQYERLRDGETMTIGPRVFRVITGFGHSTEHCALYSDSDHLLISGDMVLPRISTNVSVSEMEPQGDPVGQYLDSLSRYEPLPDDTLTLPSHGKPFRGLHTRIKQLRDHHAARLAEVRDACERAPQSAADIVPIMFRRELDLHQMTFAIGEALAHLHWLWRRGEVERLIDGVPVRGDDNGNGNGNGNGNQAGVVRFVRRRAR
jgi:glyoxylase-like metal-dependent hydrolase (beta-lactamase superfamily II)